jgi:hypothetical protein
MNSCNLVTILSVLLLVMFIWMIFQRSREGYTYKTFKPLHRSYPYTSTGIVPRGSFNRMNYSSPGFYTGSGLIRELRPGIRYKHYPRNKWLKHNGRFHHISNFGELRHNVANYDYIRRYSCCD